MGRPKADIDFDKVDKYLQAQCDGAGIAGLLGICADTLYLKIKEKYKMTFSAYQQQKRAEGQEMLRAKQFQMAMAGDRLMQIWLGKQYLGQKDKTDVTTDNRPINENEVTHKWVVEDPKPKAITNDQTQHLRL